MENQKIMRSKDRAGFIKSAAKFYWIPLILCGIFAGALLSLIIVEGLVARRTLSAELALAGRIRERRPLFAASQERALLLAEKNPFRADVRSPQETASGGALPLNIDSLKLKGTLPDVGAWFEEDGRTYLVLKGQKIAAHVLDEIHYNHVTFASGEARYSLYLTISGAVKRESNRGGNNRRRAQRRRPAPPQREEAPSGIEAATASREGVVPRELVNTLLMNPYEELAKVRMVPTADASGMRMESLADDSILSRVGVQQGDVINAVNGVQIANAADASNALNSLLSGNRFDVSVIRGGEPIHLRYQVR